MHFHFAFIRAEEITSSEVEIFYKETVPNRGPVLPL